MKASIENTAVVIPAYNAGKYLEELVTKIKVFFPKENIILVNDASKDNTGLIGKSLNIDVVGFDINKGKGAALKAGFEHALKSNFKFAFSIDADLQHNPASIPAFLNRQNVSEADMVIGKREFKTGIMPFHRICSNTITSQIVSWVSRCRIYDSQSGYRLYRLEFLKGMEMITERYQFESEIIIEYARKGGKFDYVPIETIYHGQESHISNFRDIKNFIKIIIHEIFHGSGDQ